MSAATKGEIARLVEALKRLSVPVAKVPKDKALKAAETVLRGKGRGKVAALCGAIEGLEGDLARFAAEKVPPS